MNKLLIISIILISLQTILNNTEIKPSILIRNLTMYIIINVNNIFRFLFKYYFENMCIIVTYLYNLFQLYYTATYDICESIIFLIKSIIFVISFWLKRFIIY